MSSYVSLESELSSSELRSKLYQSFKSKGVTQSVKAQLRKQLALALHEKAILSNNRRPDTARYDGSLFQRICNSLFLDHLRRCSYDYTLSVFTTECQTGIENAIPALEILELLHVNAESKLHQTLSTACADKKDVKGFLWKLIVAIAQSHGQSSTEKCVQTDAYEQSPNLDKKLFEIEKLQLEKIQSTIKNDYESVEAKVLSFQRRYESQKQAELKSELEAFRSSELTTMRIEEREKCQRELQVMKNEHQKRFELKLKDLERRELEINEKAFKQEKVSEKEGYEQRQKILDEMETLKQRDIELKRSHKSAMSAVEIEEERIRSREEQFKLKEKSVEEMEEQFENKLKHEVMRIKLELQEKQIEQESSMEKREHQLREEKMNFLSQKDVYMKWKEEADRYKEEYEKSNSMLTNAKRAYEVLSHKYEKVAEQYNQVCTYGDVKNDNMVLQKEIEISRKSITDLVLEKSLLKKEHHKLVRELLNKINQISPEQENEIKGLQEREKALALKYQVLQTQHEVLQKGHAIQIKRNDQLRKLYENNLASHNELLRECDELKLELHFAKQENDCVAKSQNDKPKMLLPSSVSRTVKNVEMPPVSTASSQIQHDWNLVADVDGPNEVLQRLEQEAQELEKSYKQFQERQQSLKTHLPVYMDRSKPTPRAPQLPPMVMSPLDDNHDLLEDITPAQLNAMLKSDSFDLSHLIPSRGMADSLDGRNVSKYSSSTPVGNQSSVILKKPLTSSELSGQRQSTTEQKLHQQIDSALSRMEGTTSDYMATTKSTRLPDPSARQTLPSRYSESQGPPPHSESMYDTVSALPSEPTPKENQLPYQTIMTESTSQVESAPLASGPIDFLTQIPLVESQFPVDSLTQFPINSLTQFPLAEATQQRESLMQYPLVETLQQPRNPTSDFYAAVELTQKPMDSLTQLPYIDTMQTQDLLTQYPLLETPFPVVPTTTATTSAVSSHLPISSTKLVNPMTSLTQISLTETALPDPSLTQNSLEEESRINYAAVTPHVPTEHLMRKQIAKRMIEENNTYTVQGIVGDTEKVISGETKNQQQHAIETLDSNPSDNSNTQNEDFDSKNDIFKTTNFMVKGFQSTRISNDESHKQEVPVAIKSTLVETDEETIRRHEETMRRHSTPDNLEKNSSAADNTASLSGGKPLNSSIRKDNRSADSSNILSGPYDSEERHSASKKEETAMGGDLKRGDFEQTFSEGEVSPVNGKSDGEVSHAVDGTVRTSNVEGEVVETAPSPSPPPPPENPMEQFMKMALERRKEGPKSEGGSSGGNTNEEREIFETSVHEEAPLSEIKEMEVSEEVEDFEEADEQSERSEKSDPTTSEFEW